MTRFAKVATASAVLLGFASSGKAAGQSVEESIGQSPNEESQILEQRADHDQMRAEAERATAEAVEAGQQMSGGGFPQGSSAPYIVPSGTNDFAILKVPTYVLPNGVAIQVSGDFSPGEGVTCTSLCPSGFQQ